MPVVQDTLNLLVSLVNAGVIGVSGYVLYRVWNVMERQEKGIPKRWMTAFVTVMAFTVILVLVSAVVELTKFFGTMRYNKQVAHEMALSQDIIEQARAIVSQEFFDPQTFDSGDDHYVGRAPNGLLPRVRMDSVFQDFKAEEYLVQRLWADPAYEESFVRAWKPAAEHCLMVEFCRKGLGCDLTLKPKGNEAIKTTGFSKMTIEARMEERSVCKKPVGFHVRVIDGRGNHWAWGGLVSLRDGTYPSVVYSLIDANGKEMVLTSTTDRFVFDITSRNKWTPFMSDGSAAPLNAPSDPFTCIQGVVIEPGIYPERGDSDEPSRQGDRNYRKVKPSPNRETSLMSVWSVRFE